MRTSRHVAVRSALPVLLASALWGCVAESGDAGEAGTGLEDTGTPAPTDAAGSDSSTQPSNDAGPSDTGSATDAARDAAADVLADAVAEDTRRFAYEPAAAVMPRLTEQQYRNTLRDLFGDALPATPVEPDTNPYLFRNIGASQTTLSAAGVELYADAALRISALVFDEPARRARVLDCEPAAADDGCAERFVRNMGLRLYRRPLTEAEVVRWLALSREVAAGDPLLGLETVLAALLQSPHFLYRIELGEPDPTAPDRMRYTAYEMAQRISFLLWNTTPDDELLAAAGRGELLDDDSIAFHVRRMFPDPRSRESVQEFFAQYLDLGRLHDIERDPVHYPGASPALFAAMEQELRLLVDDVVFRQDLDIRELFSAPRGYVNSDLAALYGVDAPGASQVSFVPVTFPPDLQRAGILTLGAFLTMNAHQTETSPTLRGKYLRERVLCTPVPPPPDDIDLNLDPAEGSPPTLRERLEQHREDPACSGCHAFIDPPGFLFEHYDSIGRYRDTAEGYPIHAAGDLDGTPLNNAAELAEMLRVDVRVGDCVARQMYRHANARLETLGERQVLLDLQRRFGESGYRFRELITAVALSEGFRTVAPAAAAEETAP